MVGEAFEVEDLGPGLAEGVEEASFAGSGEAAEDVDGDIGGFEEAGEVLAEEAAPGFVAAVEDAGPPADGAEDDGHGAGAHATAPAVDQGSPIAVAVGKFVFQVTGDPFADESGTAATGGELVVFVDGADFGAFLVVEDGEVDGAGDVVFLELDWSADVDDFAKAGKIQRKGNYFNALLDHGLLHLDDEADFDGGVEGEGGRAEGDAGVFAGFAEDLEEEVGGAVDDLGVIGKIGGGIDEALEVHDPADLVEGADFLADDGEAVEDDVFGGGGGTLDGDCIWDLAGDDGAVLDGEATGEEEEVAGADAVDVGGDRGGDLGKGETEFVESGFCRHGDGVIWRGNRR